DIDAQFAYKVKIGSDRFLPLASVKVDTLEVSGYHAAVLEHNANRLIAHDTNSGTWTLLAVTPNNEDISVSDNLLAAVDTQGKLRVWPWNPQAKPPDAEVTATPLLDATKVAVSKGCEVDSPETCTPYVIFTTPNQELFVGRILAGMIGPKELVT